MKQIFTLLLSVLFFTVNAQQQIENAGFENWEDAGTVSDEPVDWSSIKTADALAGLAPEVWSQSTDAHSGSYSIKLENISSFGIVANGIITTGRIHADMNPENGYVFTDVADAQWNSPFTDLPDSLVGWYKYTPSGSDAGKAQVVLHTGAAQNPDPAFTNWVAEARFDFSGTTSSWTRFSVPFTYYNANTPAYLLAVLVAGDSTVSVAGSIALFDDLELIYNTPVSINEVENDIANVYVSNNYLNINFNETMIEVSTAQIIDISGRVVWEQKINSVNTYKKQIPVNAGMYVLTLNTSKGLLTKKILIN